MRAKKIRKMKHLTKNNDNYVIKTNDSKERERKKKVENNETHN